MGPPLDFVAVTDHAEFLGVNWELVNPEGEFASLEISEQFRPKGAMQALGNMSRFFKMRDTGELPDALFEENIMRRAWKEIQDAAKTHNDPGAFTTFVAYEYTAASKKRNLHRNIIFKDDVVPDLPFSSRVSGDPRDLWRYLDEWRDKGVESISIPHNSNASDGIMFGRLQYDGSPFDSEYIDLRARNEKLVEVAQVKGASETHPALSPKDLWADFEIFDFYTAGPIKVENFKGGYIRDALKDGLHLHHEHGKNPYQLGFVGGTDTHNGTPGAVEEHNFHGKFGFIDSTALFRGVYVDNPVFKFAWKNLDVPPTARAAIVVPLQFGAAGLTGVWATENTRDAIYTGLDLRLTFATSGPRISL